MEPREYQELFRKLASGLGVKAIERFVAQLDFDRLIESASELMGEELRQTLTEILQDTDLAPLRELIDRLYQDLDTDLIVNAISQPLATNLAEWLKDEGADYLAGAVVEELDLTEIAELVAARVASRVQIVPE